MRGLTLIAAVAAISVSCSQPATVKSVRLTMEGLRFLPETAEVSRGDTVWIVNESAVPHTVTFRNGPELGAVARSDSVAYRASERGEFTYVCDYHPGMEGLIVVE